MSYGGHALDMIKRLQEGRESLNRRRQQTKNRRLKNLSTGSKPQNVTAEEFEQMRNALRERESEQKHYFNRMTLILTFAVLAVTIVACILIKIFIL